MAYHPVIRELGVLGRDVVALDVDYFASELAYLSGDRPLHSTDCYFQIPATETRAVFERDGDGNLVLDRQGRPILLGHETVPHDVEAAVLERLRAFATRHEAKAKRGESRNARLVALATWEADYDRLSAAEKAERDPDGLLARSGLRAMKVERTGRLR